MATLRRSSISYFTPTLYFYLLIFLPLAVHGGGGVFMVKRKFEGRPTITDLHQHDKHRHARLLFDKAAAIDVPLGGSVSMGFYYTELEIGTPPKNFTVIVDTGSDALWVNCKPCTGCVKSETLRSKMALYDGKISETSRNLSCYDSFCKTIGGIQLPQPHRHMLDNMTAYCKRLSKEKFDISSPDMPCPLYVGYGDGHKVFGNYVTDLVTYNRVSGQHKTQPARAKITFGCASFQNVVEYQQIGLLTNGVDGLIGFTQTNLSIISQLASTGQARKIFAHCLVDPRSSPNKRGGIFAIGQVLQPRVTRMTPLVPDMLDHYHVNMKSVQVGDEFLQLPNNSFQTEAGNSNTGTMIDSGTTLTYLHPLVVNGIKNAMSSSHNITFFTAPNGYASFNFTPGSESKDFPVVKFHFENSVELAVTADEYLLPGPTPDIYQLGFQVSDDDKNGLTILGGLVLTNKLVVYDLEKQAIGFTKHDCSTSIVMEDEATQAGYAVDGHDEPAQLTPPTCPSPN